MIFPHHMVRSDRQQYTNVCVGAQQERNAIVKNRENLCC